MRNRALSRTIEDRLDIHVEGLSGWLSDISIHEPNEIPKALRRIAKEGGLAIKDIRRCEDYERVNWRELGGRPARNPRAPGEVERRMDDLLDCLREESNRRAYVYAISTLAEALEYEATIIPKSK